MFEGLVKERVMGASMSVVQENYNQIDDPDVEEDSRVRSMLLETLNDSDIHYYCFISTLKALHPVLSTLRIPTLQLHASNSQIEEHPSPPTTLPSSHYSSNLAYPSPHTELQLLPFHGITQPSHPQLTLHISHTILPFLTSNE